MSKQCSSELLKLEREGNGFTKSLLLNQRFVQKTPQSENKTFKVSSSSVLGSVKAFLPKIAAANCELERKLAADPSTSVDIENTDDCTGEIIEMNLALVERESSDEDTSSESGCELDDSDSHSESTSDSDSATALRTGSLGQVTEGNFKTSGRSGQRKPQILVLSGDHLEESEYVDESQGYNSVNNPGKKPG